MALKTFYDYMEKQKYPINATFIFVYNDYNTYSDDPHLEECFDEQEVREIIDSVRDIFQKTLCFGSEKAFIEWCCKEWKGEQNVYVYTMAQYINGFARRTLIPALCQYYGFVNINADTYMSAIGCNKQVMYNLLSLNKFDNSLVPTIFINKTSIIDINEVRSTLGEHIIIKPINESCCIDTTVLNHYTEKELKEQTQKLINKYDYAMIQKYILGDEIGVTVFCHDNKMYTLAPMQIVFLHGKTHLTHIDSFYGNYNLEECQVPQKLLETCKSMSIALGFNCTTRYDFRYDGSGYYLFDISPNPTVNGYTSSNFAARITLQGDHRSILRLMVYEKIFLFEPSFNGTK